MPFVNLKIKLYYIYRSKLEGKLFFPNLDNHHKLSYKKWVDDKKEDASLTSMLISGEPFFFARCGAVELNAISDYLCIKGGIQEDYTEYVYEAIKTNAGVFPSSREILDRFCNIYLHSLHNITDFAVWMKKPFQQFIVKNFSKPKRVFDAKVTYAFDYSYIYHLKGKTVLVISPFAKTINEQYEKRKEKHINEDILSDFNLVTYKAIVSNADEKPKYKDWFEALYKMFNDVKDIDYDVVILSCGAYGLVLGSLLYEYKQKQILHLGGSVQILFGIRGKYFDSLDEVSKRINNFWVYPSDEETPKGSYKVENGSYWKP